MSVLLGSLLIGAGGALLGRFIAKVRAEQRASALEDAAKAKEDDAKKEVDPDEAKATAEVEAEVPTAKDESAPRLAEAAKAKKPKAQPRPVSGASARLEGFVCQLGDVLTRVTGEEAWLAGGVVLSEEIPVAVLFVAPDAGHDCAIYVRPHPRSSLFWLEPLDPSAVLVGGEPPSSVEHGGVRFDRARRLPLRPRRIGVGAPDVGDGVLLAEYASVGAERLLVLKSNSGDVRAYRGLELEAGAYEVIASGDTTL